jgi:hypothetical protein
MALRISLRTPSGWWQAPRPSDLAEPAPQCAQIGCAAFGEPLELAGDRVQAEQARAALARRLVREIPHHLGSFSEPAGVVGLWGARNLPGL